MTNLTRANCELLRQGVELLSRHDAATFCAVDAATYGSGIGSHFRHVLDHYRSFLAGIETGLIDYDDRKRDTPVEKDLGAAIDVLESTIEELSSKELDPAGPIDVKVAASTEDEDVRTRSSLGRELQFLVSHTVHHYALIAIASRVQGINPNQSFGVAPSTLKYLSAIAR